MTDASNELTRLSEEFFVLQNTLDPLSATLLGIKGYDHLLPDPSREGSARGVAALRGLEERLAAIDASGFSESERVNAAVLARLAWGARIDLEEGIWETDASSESYSSPHSMVFMCVPSASVVDEASREAYLTRLVRARRLLRRDLRALPHGDRPRDASRRVSASLARSTS